MLLRLGVATAVLAIVFSGLWLSLSRLTGVSTDLSQAVLVVAAGVWSLLALFTTWGSSLLVRGLAVCALSILSVWLVSQSAEPIFLWIVGILLCVHACDAWLASRSHDPVATLGALDWSSARLLAIVGDLRCIICEGGGFDAILIECLRHQGISVLVTPATIWMAWRP